ncbi:hypothetical protein [Halospeciosus flavus]|uniref:Uncharacterized protein n=1 Tax=Halospeciosus flavus TaxID=3032283 RepID=A0ABD5Z630_9EURY|nr:hypothetical protein [Halospeciosus flavus]
MSADRQGESATVTTPVDAPSRYDAILFLIPLLLCGGLALALTGAVPFRVAAGGSSALALAPIADGLVRNPPVQD